MSIPVVCRDDAETYAKENNVSLMEAKEVLLEQENFRINPAKGYRLKMDQDGFWIGTEPIQEAPPKDKV